MRPAVTSCEPSAKEKGYVLGLIGLLIVPIVGFVALATDVGAWYGEATSVQRAADAAALAGVVWMPDTTKATQVALEVAERNGYDDADPDIEVVVEPVPGNEEQLRVIIRNFDPPVFFAGAFLSDFSISRQAIAEYVLPVPLGSPRNHLGTGDLLGANEEGFWLAVNGFCSPMEQGDHRAARFAGNWSNGGSSNDRICPDASAGASAPVGPGPNSGATSGNTYFEDNDFYDGSNTYEFYIEHPDTSEDTALYLYDPGYHNSGGPDPGSGTVTTTFTIRGPDGTPLSDSDNPDFNSCSNLAGVNNVSYGTDDTSPHVATILGNSRWALFCTIPAASQPGRYIVDVETQVSEFNSDASNAFGVLARRASLGDTCDQRFTTGCPRVYSKEWMSIFARGDSPQSDFFLAEIGSAHEGKIFRIILFDAGEGGNTISILDPEGNPVNFEWGTFDGNDSGVGTFVDVSGTTSLVGPGRASTSKFNERFIEILIPLPDDFTVAYPSGERWWKVLYDYNSNPTDRTTWSASIIGDPVRLVA
ncbi:MAG: pilus assembly protein TadG-related protein [Acidimicrobiia bacterium]|nr:pilus assembly protein TadG-related protein [Acidimicrobiia bacterium]